MTLAGTAAVLKAEDGKNIAQDRILPISPLLHGYHATTAGFTLGKSRNLPDVKNRGIDHWLLGRQLFTVYSKILNGKSLSKFVPHT